jgi:hypothetical protein
MSALLIPVTSIFHFLVAKSGLQIPKEVPHPDTNSPLDINNPADIIIYIVLPLVVIILYFLWRKKNRKKKE